LRRCKRFLAQNQFAAFWTVDPATEASLELGQKVVGGDYLWVVAPDGRCGIAFITFIGSHAAYDRIDALTVMRL